MASRLVHVNNNACVYLHISSELRIRLLTHVGEYVVDTSSTC